MLLFLIVHRNLLRWALAKKKKKKNVLLALSYKIVSYGVTNFFIIGSVQGF